VQGSGRKQRRASYGERRNHKNLRLPVRLEPLFRKPALPDSREDDSEGHEYLEGEESANGCFEGVGQGKVRVWKRRKRRKGETHRVSLPALPSRSCPRLLLLGRERSGRIEGGAPLRCRGRKREKPGLFGRGERGERFR
jgi:hypothetical protein